MGLNFHRRSWRTTPVSARQSDLYAQEITLLQRRDFNRQSHKRPMNNSFIRLFLFCRNVNKVDSENFLSQRMMNILFNRTGGGHQSVLHSKERRPGNYAVCVE